jgi:hypothetical protein
MMLVQANSRGEWEVGTHADEHAAPGGVIQIEVELVHPTLLILQVRTVIILVTDCDQNARRLAGLDDGHHLVRFGIVEVLIQKLVSPAVVAITFGGLQDGSAPLLGPVF